ncbi:hypothetical protein GE061_017879 [Apolygus lucorum]|uniref:Uncharacterized protein n=1 Tax=Apolygus lucorum TaxID=248454 RepID=A0A8S9XCE4_APOLU|nr:hypothetical protein GE061_017879 [Apolygus lucorum]
MVEQFQRFPVNAPIVYGEPQSEFSNHSNANVPFLIPVLVIPTQGVHIGSIVGDRAILTPCSSTIYSSDDMLVLVKAEQIIAVLRSISGDKVVPELRGISEIRRHPTCFQPFKGGSWKNDVAILLFSTIYSAIGKIAGKSSTTPCYAITMKFQNNELPRTNVLLPVRIEKSTGCLRTCGYMIEQCTQELGGYSVHLKNLKDMDKIKKDSAKGAAIVCEGEIFGVLEPDFACGGDSIGQLPKPEAMLYMYVNFGNPNLKPKVIIGPNSSERNGCNIAVYSIVLSWVIALSIESLAPMISCSMSVIA